MSQKLDYWKECISDAACECDLVLTPEQLDCISEAVECGHENYGLAFYSPPASDELNRRDREWKEKYDALLNDFERYKGNAESAVKQALRVHSSDRVSIGEYGEVIAIGGRTERIQ